MDLFRQLTNTRLLNAASAEQHLATMSDIRTQFINYGKPVPEWIAALLLLLSVPTDDTRWEVFLSSHTAASAATAAASADKDKAPDIKWDTVSAAIMAEASKQAQQDAERTRKQETDQAAAAAYAARMHDGSKQNTDRGTKQPRFCTHCKQKGHVVESCWQKFPKLREEAQARAHVNFVSVHDSNDVALSCRSDAALTGMPGAGVWYIDSGASYSLTGDRTWFTELYNCVPCTVTAANNGTLACTQRGTVVLNVLHGTITVKDVLFVPSLFINLLSVSALLKNGYRPRFTATGCAIVKRRKLLAEAKVHDNVYPLTATRQPAKALSAVVSSSSKGLDWATVHARLGHINPQAIQLMHDKHMVLGVDVPTQGSPDDIKKCAGCAVGKAHRLPFPAQATHRAIRPLQLVHSDVCGPMEITTKLHDGKQLVTKYYILTFIDDYSRLIWIQITNNKSGSTVMNAFIRYKIWAERYTGFDIKTLRTDGGTEYENADFRTYLHTMGIARELSVSYTPQQNGVAERANRTIMEAARSMLHAANLQLPTFWQYAVHAAVYLRNRSPTRALDNVTPYEAWRGDKPDLSHLRVFGCRAYMYLHKGKRDSTSKLAARSMPGIFVGYASEAKAWLVWDPIDKKVHTTRDVKFIESEPGSAPLKQSAVAAVPAAESNNDSVSTGAAEPTDTERSTIVNALAAADDDSDSDSEAEPAVPAEPAVAAVPAVSLPVDSTAAPTPATPATQAAIEPDPLVHVSTNSESTDGQAPRRRMTRAERAQWELASHNAAGWTEEASYRQLSAMYAFAVSVSDAVGEPRSYSEATRSPHRVQWEQAMQEEIDSIKANDTFTLVPLPPARKAIGSKWVFKVKRHADGSIDRFKARLVAKGYSQQYGVDFTETFAPVARFSSLRAILAIAAAKDYEVHQMDVKTAFLNGDLDEDIYMEQPEGYRAGGSEAHYVWKLRKSLYGLKQAGRAWNKKMDAALIDMGFRPTRSDSCVYVKRHDDTVMFLLVYFDDLLLVASDASQLESVKAALQGRFEMKDMGEAEFILGVQIRRDRAKRQLYLSQAEYIRTVLERFDMQDCKPVASPMAAGVKLLKADPTDTSSVQSMANIPYASAVGALMFAALVTRPDIAFAVTSLCQFMSAPTIDHWQAVKRVLRYLQGTRHHELVYGWAGGDDRELYGYSDSDWGNDPNDRRSFTAWVFLLHDGAVSWQSCKQPTVALSSVEAEYMAATQATREAVWWRTFMSELGQPPSAATTVHSDSQGAIALAKNPEHHKRTKHIDIQHHYVREQVDAGSVVMPHIGTELMMADVLTKPLAANRHAELTGKMGVRAVHNAA